MLGVGVTNVVARAEGQLDLFAPRERTARRARLNRALDELARRFGDGAVVRAGEGPLERAALTFQIKRGERDD